MLLEDFLTDVMQTPYMILCAIITDSLSYPINLLSLPTSMRRSSVPNPTYKSVELESQVDSASGSGKTHPRQINHRLSLLTRAFLFGALQRPCNSHWDSLPSSMPIDHPKTSKTPQAT